MASTNSSEVMPCPNCGVEVGSRDTCPACGAPIAPLLEEPDQTRWDEMSRLIESNNQNLVSAGIRAAESAFGLGCFLGAMMGMVLLVIVFALGSRNWILIGILGMVASIIAVGAAVGISTRAKSATINKAYERSAKHEIERFVLVNHLGRLEFDSLADQVLSKEAPLRKYLRLSNTPETGAAEE